MHKVEQAVEWLKKGGLVIVADDENRESEGDLIGIAEYATLESVNFMATYGRGLICAPISQAIAEKLALPEMTANNTDAFGTAFTISVDHVTTSTGISAKDRAVTIEKLADPASQAADFYRPGHIFPLTAQPGGVLERRGHTEAAVDLAKLAGSVEAAYICEILKEDGTMARVPELKKLAEKWQLPFLTIDELAEYLRGTTPITVDLPTAYGAFQLSLFEDEFGNEHLLLANGEIQHTTEPLLLRIHSECLTGDVFGSHRCDCGEQLQEAMRQIEAKGRGAILYLRQEGRGIGLRNKLRAYQLQEQGMDTYEANIALGFAADARHYTFAADVLRSLEVQEIQLMTNNPDKVKELESLGIKVAERVPLEMPAHKENSSYLKTKKEKFHHYLSI
ncbi:bifunctional 3,4-dihydroxy-2-butanone-4-phosphate synthase/GTP cyclohydrolase II [Enterococcus casseliflavus]|uniref:bifunctional 3,4-dihydroxy-2-butanone-4-phosphate synthase/GTP cyclohydrolase II n=1 Tax=Enterococcus casseliflavus TaxID=37734 RepID=UPI00042708EF|nr:bifunctional 3,4-dihydroxy-2-butanone-4-phosphate synthase/GTP cyclohydrolase II [Enterococcus casseliflavus]